MPLYTSLRGHQVEGQPFAKIAPYLTNPLVLIGFGLMLVFGIHRALLKSGVLKPMTSKGSEETVKRLLSYGFVIALLLILLGFGVEFLKILHTQPQTSQIPQNAPAAPLPEPIQRPDFTVEAPIKKIYVNGSKEPTEGVQISVVNNGAKALNTKIDCMAEVSIAIWPPGTSSTYGKSSSLAGGSYQLGCGNFTADSGYDPNREKPIMTDLQVDDAATRLAQMVAPKETTAEIDAYFHISYDDKNGTHYERYLKLLNPLVPRGDPFLADIGPQQYDKIKAQLSSQTWPCDFLDNEGCPKTLLRLYELNTIN